MSDAAPHRDKPHVVAVIPARLQSQRLPRKMLRLLAGQPLLAWTYQAARACPQLHQVIIAVDSEEVAALCRERGWEFRMTSEDLPSGTDRLYEVSQRVGADIYVNLQGDEPLITPLHIQALLAPFSDDRVEVSTLKVLCTEDEIHDPNAVKVVTTREGQALYFSRSAIPYNRQQQEGVRYFKHLGLYAYRRAALQQFATLPPSALEEAEKLEQLRLLENGISLHVEEVFTRTIGVDTEEDLAQVEAVLLARGSEGEGTMVSP